MAREALGRRPDGLTTGPGKAREGPTAFGTSASWARNPGGAQSQGGTDAGSLAKPQVRGRASCGAHKPWRGGIVSADALTNPTRVATFERTYGATGGTRPRRENPKSGTGMKQARQAERGAKRREGERPWGRNLTDGLGSRRS
jgi:hypothetical protein